MNEIDRYWHWAAVYVLGALDPGERGEYETHLAICAKCSAAVAEFSGLPQMLDALGPWEAQGVRRDQERSEEKPLKDPYRPTGKAPSENHPAD